MRKQSFINFPRRFSGESVLVRVDFNEPVKGGHIKDSFRMRATAPTIKNLVRIGARVILLAHIEDSVTKKQLSFAPYISQIARVLKNPVAFVKEYSKTHIEQAFKKSKVILLENVRFYKGEEANDPRFVQLLASLADMYINEAFSVSHRKHASIVGITKELPSYAGVLFQKEVRALFEATHPKHPCVLIIGGAKFSTKIGLLKSFLPKVDAAFIGGALANTFLHAQGVEIGTSVFERGALPHGSSLLTSGKVVLPFDVRVSHKETKSVFEVRHTEKIYDVGPRTIALLSQIARSAKMVIWNGPLGFIEGGYDAGTRALLKNLAQLKKTKVILGGGDTVEVLDAMHLAQHFYHVSTGGGAMLDFLADGTLPGIDAIVRAQKRLK